MKGTIHLPRSKTVANPLLDQLQSIVAELIKQDATAAHQDDNGVTVVNDMVVKPAGTPLVKAQSEDDFSRALRHLPPLDAEGHQRADLAWTIGPAITKAIAAGAYIRTALKYITIIVDRQAATWDLAGDVATETITASIDYVRWTTKDVRGVLIPDLFSN
jgi:hypothetical protein